MTTLILIGAFIFGSIIGSFLNVLIYRFNTGLSLMTRSSCMSCSTQLVWYDMLPAGISYVVLRGKCRSCKSAFSFQYPVAEVLTGLLFLGIIYKLGLTLQALISLVIFSVLVVIGVYDLKHKIIPNPFVYTFIALGFLYNFVIGNTVSSVFFNNSTLYTALILFGIFGALWLFSGGRIMGFGDAKLVLGIGLFLGMIGGISATVLGFWIGALVGVALLVYAKFKGGVEISGQTEIPFAPFLLLGVLLVFFWDINVLVLTF